MYLRNRPAWTNRACCHTEIKNANQTFCLTQSQCADIGPTNSSTDPVTPGPLQGRHQSVNISSQWYASNWSGPRVCRCGGERPVTRAQRWFVRRDGSTNAHPVTLSLCADTCPDCPVCCLRLTMQAKLVISRCHCVLTPVQSVPALTLQHACCHQAFTLHCCCLLLLFCFCFFGGLCVWFFVCFCCCCCLFVCLFLIMTCTNLLVWYSCQGKQSASSDLSSQQHATCISEIDLP